MSRSVRKNPVAGWSRHDSEKSDKLLWHRKMRAIMRRTLHRADPDLLLMPVDNDAGNTWCFYKDGKWRFDPREEPKRMRK